MATDIKKLQNMKILEQYAKHCEIKINKSAEEVSKNVLNKK